MKNGEKWRPVANLINGSTIINYVSRVVLDYKIAFITTRNL